LSAKRAMPGGIFFKPGPGNAGELPFEELPAPSAVTIPLVQYRETPARPLVGPGDRVSMGQMIGSACGGGGAPVHASVSGTVTDVSRCRWAADPAAMSVTIENDGRDEFASPIPYDGPWREAEPAGLLEKLKKSGVIDGNGDRCVALHEKFSAAQGGKADTLVVSLLSTEPYCPVAPFVTAGQIEKLAAGVALCRKLAGAERCVIIAGETDGRVLQAAPSLRGFPLVIMKKARYPQHEERFAARAAGAASRRRRTAAGRSVVVSAPAVLAARAAIEELMPDISRIVTVAGPAVSAPKHLTARIGTPLRLLLEACGADLARAEKIVAGGPVSGAAVPDPAMPVTKSTHTLLVLDRTPCAGQQHPCIGCRRCYAVCPVRLEPSHLARLARAERTEELERRGVMECLECGCCAYVCPSKVNLVHFLMSGKSLVRRRRGGAV
jgi:electron transport complex protein RnfC